MRFWSVSEGKETGKVENPYAYGVTVDPTDRYFATAPIPTLQVVDAPAVVWELRTRSSKATLRNDRGVYLLAFNSNWQGNQIATASDQQIRVWDSWSGSLLRTFGVPTQDGSTSAIGFSPDGAVLASTHANGVVRLWNPRPPGAAVLELQKPVEPRFLGQTRIATVSDGGTVELHEFPSLELLSELRADWNFVETIAVTDAERVVVAGTPAGAKSAEIWNGLTKRQVGSCQSNGIIQVTVLSPTGNAVAIGGDLDDPTVRLCDTSNGALLKVLQGHEAAVEAIAFDRSGSMIASGSTDRTVRIWNLSDEKAPQVLVGHETSVLSLAFSPDNSFLVSGSLDRTARVWDITTGKQKFMLTHEGSVSAVAVDPTGKIIATGGADRVVYLWDADNGNPIGQFRGLETRISNILFSPDGHYLLVSGSAARSSGNNLRSWRLFMEADLVKWAENLAYN